MLSSLPPPVQFSDEQLTTDVGGASWHRGAGACAGTSGNYFLQFWTGTGKLQKISLSLEREWKYQHLVSIASDQTWKKNIFLWTLKFWKYRFCRKMRKLQQILSCDKTAWILYLTHAHSFSSFWQVLHNITMLFTYYLHILLHLQAMKMIFLKLFLICTFKDPNLAENLTNLKIFFLNLTLWSSRSSFFPSLFQMGPKFWANIGRLFFYIKFLHSIINFYCKPFWRALEVGF